MPARRISNYSRPRHAADQPLGSNVPEQERPAKLLSESHAPTATIWEEAEIKANLL